ncbi:hypothetical protein WJX79_008441 [Trebouxia sp. C0005]
MPLSVTVGDLKQEAHELLGIPPAMQKLLIKGQMNPDGTTLQQAGLRSCVRKAAGHPLSCCPSFFSWLSLGLPDPFRRRPSAHTDAAQEDLDKGKPEGCMPGIACRQVQLKEVENMIPALLNGQGNTQIWIGSAASIQNVYYSQIRKIESHVIEGHEEYSMVALHLNAEGKGKYWLYWFPSQFTAALKVRIIGVAALI